MPWLLKSLSSVPVVGCRNEPGTPVSNVIESIKRSGGGVSERSHSWPYDRRRVYQAFRWWGVGTCPAVVWPTMWSLSSVPVVGCRNLSVVRSLLRAESIKRSGGGVSERASWSRVTTPRVYQAFRWWGVGTAAGLSRLILWESIKRSGGGVSEQVVAGRVAVCRVYQAFRWWGVGTAFESVRGRCVSLSSVPVVGCRNKSRRET